MKNFRNLPEPEEVTATPHPGRAMIPRSTRTAIIFPAGFDAFSSSSSLFAFKAVAYGPIF